ncbi:MAG: leucine-rich repeat domain-containing protein [Oscillospiraceae bacterium]|jgi:hypothetical protein|nr:leucine-rich repeat domain-containing protein [Oscillospiraceae bacterium]
MLSCDICGGELVMDSGLEFAKCGTCGVKYPKDALRAKTGATKSAPTTTANPMSDFVIRAGILEKYIGAATDVVIPDGVEEIGRMAFYGTNIKNVVIPKTVKSIGDRSFGACYKLNSVTIMGSELKFHNIDSFDGAKRLVLNDNNIKQIDYYGHSSTFPFSLLTKFKELDFTPELTQSLGEEKAQQEKWRLTGKCVQCGGVKTFFTGKCKTCGTQN